MKTLKFLTVLGVLAFFTFDNINAQTSKEVYVHTAYLCFDKTQLPCIGETIRDELSFVEKYWGNGKWQMRTTGTLVGASGDVYTAFQIENIMTKELKKGIAEYFIYPGTCILNKKGAPPIVIHWVSHYTIDANGEWIFSIDKYFAECH
jgi:hypothetical protein